MYQSQAQQPPVPFDQVDQNTFNHNLPQGNDVWPQLNVPQPLGGPIVGRIISEFRALAQSRVMTHNATPLHMLAYNLMSQNYFNNQLFSDWCQRAVDFAEFLVVVQRNSPDVAVQKAVMKIYRSFLAVTAAEYTVVAQQLDQRTYNDLLEASREFQDIMNDIKAFHANGRQAQPPGYGGGQPYGGGYGGQPAQPYGMPQGGGYGMGGGYGQGGAGQLPPVGAAPRPAPAPAPAPAGYGQTGQTVQPGTVGRGSPSAGRYVDDVEPVKPQSWSSGTGMGQGHTPTQTTAPAQPEPVVQDEPEGIPPANLDAVVMDPYAFVPKGKTIDRERPYDHFYNPGGVEIVPAHLSKWKRTKGSETPYAIGHDPEEYVLFHVRWPDGVVQEKIVTWDIEMDYLKHEINDKLRGLKIKPEGKVIASQHMITDYDALDTTTEVLETKVEGPLDVQSELNPVQIATLFSASSDLENELMARSQLIEDLELPADTKKLPAYEYTSGCLFPIDLPKEVEQKLFAVTESKGMVGVAKRLQNLVESGELPVRYYRFFNERLTKALNTVLADNLALPNLKMDSFVDDVEELYDVFKHSSKYDSDLVTVLDSQTPMFLKRWFNLAYEQTEGDGDGQLSLFEEVVNLQTRWATEEIASLNLTPEQPVLISQTTHAKLYEVLLSMVRRNTDKGNLPNCRLRIVSSDGHYYEVIRGWLVEGSILLKDLG